MDKLRDRQRVAQHRVIGCYSIREKRPLVDLAAISRAPTRRRLAVQAQSDHPSITFRFDPEIFGAVPW